MVLMKLYHTVTSLGTTEVLIAAVALFVSLLFILIHSKKKKNLPPGPRGLPVVGYLPYLRKEPHLRLLDLASKYGDVFSLYLGGQLVVVLNGVDAIKEGMNKIEFLGRPPHGAFSFNADIPSIVNASGKAFHEQRKFMLNCMKNLGFGKSVLEECMKDEIEYFLRVLEKRKGQPQEVKTILVPSVSNNITTLVYGTRFDFEDSRRTLIDSQRKIVTEFFAQTAIHIFLPWIKKIPFVKTFFGYDRAVDAFDALLQFNRDQIEEHRKTFDPNNIRDYIDSFLLEMQEVKKKKTTDTSFTENMLIGTAGTLTGAGSETVQATMDWCLYIMAIYPDVQRKVQREIDSVVGAERAPSYSDHKLMPYTQAVTMEIMRWKTISALNLLRYASDDTSFRGYHIPRKTIILANLWSAHYDTRYWEVPEIFKPERFLTPDGQRIVKSEGFMPFSVGKRACPGESMAAVELFIYFTTILQRFDICLPKGDVPDLDGILKLSYSPKTHKLCFTPRLNTMKKDTAN